MNRTLDSVEKETLTRFPLVFLGESPASAMAHWTGPGLTARTHARSVSHNKPQKMAAVAAAARESRPAQPRGVAAAVVPKRLFLRIRMYVRDCCCARELTLSGACREKQGESAALTAGFVRDLVDGVVQARRRCSIH
jgi:hypothetical protein